MTQPLFMTHHARARVEQRRIGQAGLRAATLYGDRFVQFDGSVLHLVTRRAAQRLKDELGLRPGYVDDHYRGVYVVMSRSGAVVTAGRRWQGAGGRIRRS